MKSLLSVESTLGNFARKACLDQPNLGRATFGRFQPVLAWGSPWAGCGQPWICFFQYWSGSSATFEAGLPTLVRVRPTSSQFRPMSELFRPHCFVCVRAIAALFRPSLEGVRSPDSDQVKVVIFPFDKLSPVKRRGWNILVVAVPSHMFVSAFFQARDPYFQSPPRKS